MPDRAQPLKRLRWSGMTHTGRFRKNNEDAFLALLYNGYDIQLLGKEGEASFEQGDFVFAVSDGMGGANAGEFASRIAVQKISELFLRNFKLKAGGMASETVELLGELVELIHAELRYQSIAYEECRGMGATLSLLWVTPTRTYFAHVGDSRIYFLPSKDPMMQVTHDHTHAGSLFRKGKINEREARNHPGKNQLEMSLGGRRETVDPQLGAVIAEKGDRFVLCTDGIIDGVWNANLERMIREPNHLIAHKSPCLRLIDEANETSGRDNMTALVLEMLE